MGDSTTTTATSAFSNIPSVAKVTVKIAASRGTEGGNKSSVVITFESTLPGTIPSSGTLLDATTKVMYSFSAPESDTKNNIITFTQVDSVNPQQPATADLILNFSGRPETFNNVSCDYQ